MSPCWEKLGNLHVSQTAVPARATSLGRQMYLPLGSPLALPCRYVGSPAPEKKWFKDGREIDWDGTPQSTDLFLKR